VSDQTSARWRVGVETLSSGHKGKTIRRLPVEDIQVPVHVINDVRSRVIASPSAEIDIEVFRWLGQNGSKLLYMTGGP
jgi:hypothetical protein